MQLSFIPNVQFDNVEVVRTPSFFKTDVHITVDKSSSIVLNHDRVI